MADYTPTSGAYFNDDGSIGIGTEVFFEPADAATPATVSRTWPINPVNAVELWGTVAMRCEDKADVLVGIFLDSRKVFAANLKVRGAGTTNIWCHAPAMALKTPATALRVDIQAGGAGDAWPINCEVELSGRWE